MLKVWLKVSSAYIGYAAYAGSGWGHCGGIHRVWVHDDRFAGQGGGGTLSHICGP